MGNNKIQGNKVFTLRQEPKEGIGWFGSPASTNNKITGDQMTTVKVNLSKIPSSIPSPFAQIDLVKTAFGKLAGPNYPLEGDTAYHKLVSYALDVAQLFFDIDKFKDQLRIISWDPNERFADLPIDTELKEHSHLVDSLLLYWDQDKKQYNFNEVNKFYFLINEKNEIIGSTSPATIFMSAPDVEKHVGHMPPLIIGTHTLFSGNYCSLAKRTPDFIEYLYLLKKTNKSFAKKFNEFSEYLTEVEKKLPESIKKQINNQQSISLETKYNKLHVTDNKMEKCEILGKELWKNKEGNVKLIEKTSDFVIKPDYDKERYKSRNEKLPLILPNTTFNEDWIYTVEGVTWSDKYEIPSKNPHPFDGSKLPYVNDAYPWLSVDNFFEEKVFKLPFYIDMKNYNNIKHMIYEDNNNDKIKNKFILPLNEQFFKYFKTENIKQYVEYDETPSGIKFHLKIPVRKGILTLTKSYNKEDIIDLDIHLAVAPFIRDINNYTIAIFDKRNFRPHEIEIYLYKNGKLLQEEFNPVIRYDDGTRKYISISVEQPFDLLFIKMGEIKGAIIPHFHEKGKASNEMKFAVDFGTTNTHIEYVPEKNKQSKPFDENGEMWKSLMNNNLIDEVDEDELRPELFYEKLIIPHFIGEGEIKFPLRTALLWNKNTHPNLHIKTFVHSNNYLFYGIRQHETNFTLFTDIKWQDSKKAESYIDYILKMIHYKAHLSGIVPQAVKVIWFYPVSMSSTNLDDYRKIWKNKFVELFGKENVEKRLLSYPESIAPFYGKKNEEGVNLVVDIGGGSTDVALVEHGKNPAFIGSFRFAGNAMYGDGFSNPGYANYPESNGIVMEYRNKAEDLMDLLGKDGMEKRNILNSILNSNYSREFINFMFQLEKDPNIDFSFTDLLRKDNKYKLNILIYYAALAYYLAQLSKNAGQSVPNHILFSGMASKSIKILDSSDKLKRAAKIFNYFFTKVYNKDTNIHLHLDENPKKITAKGGLKIEENINPENIPVLFWVGADESLKEKGKNIIRYKELNQNDDIFKAIKDNILEFYKLLDEFAEKKVDISDIFGISYKAYETFKDMREHNIIEKIEMGLVGFNKKDDDPVDETMFFYPIVAILNKLPLELYNMNRP